MRRRNFLALGPASLAMARTSKRPRPVTDSCGCSLLPQAGPAGVQAFSEINSGIKITGLKVFGVSLNPRSDRPYVFVKLETNQVSSVGAREPSKARPAPSWRASTISTTF